MRALVAMALVLTLFNVAAAKEFAGYPVVPVTVDGQRLVSAVPPINVLGTTMVPLRVVSEALGASIAYNPTTGDVAITRPFTVSESDWRELRATIEAIASDTATLKSRLTTAERSAASLTKGLASTQQELTAAKKDLAAATETIERLQADLADAKSAAATREGGFNVPELVAKVAPAAATVHAYDQSGELISSASAVFVSPEGDLVTVNHFIEDAALIKVVTHDRRVFMTTDFWGDSVSDLAFLKVAGTGFAWASWVESTERVRPGEPVVMIGNPNWRHQSVLIGSVSATNRTSFDNGKYPSLQMQMPVAGGASGAPIFNAAGQIVGIHMSSIDAPDATFIGFAIPVETLRHIQAIAIDKIVIRPWLGLTLAQFLDASIGIPTTQGLGVLGVAPGQPADTGGITTRDHIIAVNGVSVTNLPEFRVQLEKSRPGDRVTLSVKRGSTTRQVSVTLAQDTAANKTALPVRAAEWWQGEF